MGTLGSDDTFLFDGFRFDRKAGGLFRLDRAGNVAPVALGSRTLDLLALLARHRGEAVSKDQIFSEVWSGRAVEETNLNVQISKLRHILDEGRAQGSCIQTITGYGYRFVEGGPATRSPPPSTAAGGDNGAPAQAVAVTRPPGFRESPAGVAPRRPLSPRAMRYGAALSALGIVVLLMTSVDWPISWLRASRPEAPPQSIVVLPFADLSDDQKQRNLADGIVQDLTTDLSRSEQMTVIAGSTAAAYGHKSPDTRTIGRELGGRYVLEGSVEGTGDQVRVAAQLSDAKTAANLWADRFDGGAGNRFGFQDEITGHIAAALGPAMVTADAARVVDHPELLDFIHQRPSAQTNPPITSVHCVSPTCSRLVGAEGRSLPERP
jgi:TolB-like protein/DNA-binding winged helix-turn-helix (wHTH) protein